MPRRVRCAKLRNDANSNDWAEMVAFYCHQASLEDIQMAREVNAVCVKLVGIITERGRFIEELESVDNFFVNKTVEHLRELQIKDDQKVDHMVIMTEALDLSAHDKDVFVMKLKGVMDF